MRTAPAGSEGAFAPVVTEAGVWSRAAEVLLWQAPYNTRVVLLGTALLGAAAGIVGLFALLRRRSLTADALSHATLPGIAAAFLLASALGSDGRSRVLLLVGAAVTGVLGVAGIQVLSKHPRIKEDAAIGIVLSVFFGVGVVLMSVVQLGEGGNRAGLGGLIYGQAAAMRGEDAALMGVLAIASVAVALLLAKEMSLAAFDAPFARATGWATNLIDGVLLGLIVLVTVAGLQAVGLILVVAMLVVPAAAARLWSDRVRTLVPVAGVFGALAGYLGAGASAVFEDTPTGATIVLTSGVLFGVGLLVAPRRGVIAVLIRRARARARYAADHLLEALHELGGSAGAADLARLRHERGWSPLGAWGVERSTRGAGLVRREGERLVATERGAARGRRVRRNHLLWAEYLVHAADVAPTHVDWSVDRVEHVLSRELRERLEASLARRGVVVPSEDGSGSA